MPTTTYYANTSYLPRELRGEPATGETCHHGRALAGEGCAACAAEAVQDTRFNADDLATLRVRAVAPLTDDELGEIVYGYVTAATWADLDKPCERCEGSGEVAPESLTDDDWGEVESDIRADLISRMVAQSCPDCENGGSAKTGSDPYEYGPDDLDAESAKRVREIVASFAGEPGHWSFATTSDIRLYEDLVGGMTDHPQAAGGRQLGAREVSALQRIGGTLYLTASGHGVAFTDDEWPERDDMPRERREYNGMLRRLERAASGHGLDAVMLCSDGTIQVTG